MERVRSRKTYGRKKDLNSVIDVKRSHITSESVNPRGFWWTNCWVCQSWGQAESDESPVPKGTQAHRHMALSCQVPGVPSSCDPLPSPQRPSLHLPVRNETPLLSRFSRGVFKLGDLTCFLRNAGSACEAKRCAVLMAIKPWLRQHMSDRSWSYK